MMTLEYLAARRGPRRLGRAIYDVTRWTRVFVCQRFPAHVPAHCRRRVFRRFCRAFYEEMWIMRQRRQHQGRAVPRQPRLQFYNSSITRLDLA